jgi:hypothetical protein
MTPLSSNRWASVQQLRVFIIRRSESLFLTLRVLGVAESRDVLPSSDLLSCCNGSLSLAARLLLNRDGLGRFSGFKVYKLRNGISIDSLSKTSGMLIPKSGNYEHSQKVLPSELLSVPTYCLTTAPNITATGLYIANIFANTDALIAGVIYLNITPL